MKKVFLFVLFLIPFLSAQQNNKGNISLIFNGEKYDLPVSTILVNKLNGISLKFSAEQNDLKMQKKIAMELKLKELSSNPDAEILGGTLLDIENIDITNSGNILFIRFGDENDSGAAYYGVINKGEKSQWEVNSVSLRINLTDVNYNNGALHITGEFSGLFKSKDAPEDQYAEIKDGKFEIII